MHVLLIKDSDRCSAALHLSKISKCSSVNCTYQDGLDAVWRTALTYFW